ncbi:MAG: glycosyltransferase family 39 protein, partial [Nanoarchaeota archaeon]|nr:glycosyltransferase family 39 protein [Nanoarchaeota archaeon]
MGLNKKTAILLILIILTGLVLRFSAIDKEGYWLDEGFTLITATKPNLMEVTNSVLFYETSPPLYFYILNIWVELFGNSPYSTRALSALFGTIAIVFVFLISKKISDEKIALFTTFLFSVSMLNLWVSQEARPYALFVLLSLVSTFFLVNILTDKNNKTQHLFYFFSLIILIYTSYFTVFIIFFHFMSFLFVKKYHLLKKIFLIQVLAILTITPWLLKAFTGYDLRQGVVYEILHYHANLPKFIAQFGQFALVSPLILLSFLTFLIYFINLKKPIKKPKNFYNILQIFILLIFVAYFAMLLNFQIPFISMFFTWSRYFIFLFPAGYFIIAQTFFKMNKKPKIYLVILIILLNFFALYTYYSSTLKEEWIPAMEFLEFTKDSTNGMIFVDEGGANMYLIDYYYNGNMDAVELAWRNKMLSTEQVRDALQNKEFAWLILSRNWRRGEYYKKM